MKTDTDLRNIAVALADALLTLLNTQSCAEVGNEEMGGDLDVPYHYDKARSALHALENNFPNLYKDALQ